MENRRPHNPRFLFFPKSFWILATTDVCAILLSVLIASGLRSLFPGTLPLSTYLAILPGVFIFPAIYAVMHLYPGTNRHPAEEVKYLARGTSIGFVLLLFALFMMKMSSDFSRAVFLIAWPTAIFLVPLARSRVRRHCVSHGWWNNPAVLIGADAAGEYEHEVNRVCDTGYKLACSVFYDGLKKNEEGGEEIEHRADSREFHSVRVHDNESLRKAMDTLSAQYPGSTAIILLRAFPKERHAEVLNIAGEYFHNAMVIPDLDWGNCIPAQVFNLKSSFALLIRKNLCDPRRLKIKKSFDLFVSILLSVPALFLVLIFAVCIKLDSPGPVFFRQERIGRGGKKFHVFKFRTMRQDAETVLAEYLANNPAEAKEWEENQKLRRDPRITRMGVFLRKSSLDELPQLLNIFKGEMSLVGPRPIVESEIDRYAEAFSLYCRVPPGITGLWQISGRSDTSYAERVDLDKYYINNWSVWLDLYIIAKTVPVVLKMRGAY